MTSRALLLLKLYNVICNMLSLILFFLNRNNYLNTLIWIFVEDAVSHLSALWFPVGFMSYICPCDLTFTLYDPDHNWKCYTVHMECQKSWFFFLFYVNVPAHRNTFVYVCMISCCCEGTYFMSRSTWSQNLLLLNVSWSALIHGTLKICKTARTRPLNLAAFWVFGASADVIHMWKKLMSGWWWWWFIKWWVF